MALFRPLASVTARWRPADGVGLEHLSLRTEDHAIVADAVVIGERGGGPYGVNYRIACRRDWTVMRLTIDTTDGHHLDLASDGDAHWTEGGRARADLEGCIDVDLAATPFTNTLPIRRSGLVPGMDAAEFRMVYVSFPTLTATVDEQRYRCTGPGHYRYEAVDRTFAADLTIDQDGLVIDYPPLFHRVPI